jgi:hemolysin D
MSYEATAKLIPFPRKRAEHRRAAELEFLPAALEIIETPASPLGRVTMSVIVALVMIVVTWACLGKVDIIATATGKLIPSGQVKLIQPLEIGVVKAIHVTDGDHVSIGDLLIELDPTTDAADQVRITRDLAQADSDAARLSAMLTGDINSFVPPAGADPAIVEASRRQLAAELAQHRAKLDGLDRQVEAKIAERDGAEAAIAKVAASLPIAEQRAQIYRKLRENEYSSKVAALEVERQLVDAQHDRSVAAHQLEGAEAGIAALRQQRQETDADFHRQALDELAKARQKAAEAEQEWVKAARKIGLQTLRAPVSGTVEQLSIHTIGGVVTPAQALMVLVPDGSRMEVEAMLPNRDVGFVHPGQPAEVKIEAFTYTRYGLLHGNVDGVSRDALRTTPRDPQDNQGKLASTGGSSDSNGDRQESAYVARVSLTQTDIDTEQGRMPLEPGMAVAVEIKTGQRRVIEYLLSPLLRYRHEGLRER